MKIHGTAKGAALSTKDFGVAFGGAAAPQDYESGMGSSADWTTVSSLSTASSITTPSGLGSDYWDCDGSNISNASVQMFPINSNFSLSFWIYPTNVTTTQSFIWYITNNVLICGQEGSIFKVNVSEPGADPPAKSEQTVTHGMTASNWYNWCFTYKYTTGQWKIYKDGTRLESVSDSTNGRSVSANEAWRGLSVNAGSAEPFVGAMMEMACWNVELTSSEVSDLGSGNGKTADEVQKTKILWYFPGDDASAPITNIAIPP